MPSSSQISTRLGADNSEFSSVMNQTVSVADRGAASILKRLDIRAGVTAIAAAIGFNMQAIAENVARFALGFSKDSEEKLNELVEKTGKAAEEQIKQAQAVKEARIKLESDQAEAAYNTWKVVNDFRQKLVKDQAEEEAKYRQQLADIQSKLDEEHLDTTRENLELLTLEAKAKRGLTEEEATRLKYLREQTVEADRQQQITTLLSLKQRSPEEELVLQKLIQQSAAYKEQQAAVTSLVQGEKERTAEITKQNEGLRVGFEIRGRGNDALSPRDLEAKIAQLRQQLMGSDALDQNPLGMNLFTSQLVTSQDPFRGFKQRELDAALAEQRLRSSVQRRIAFAGEDRAFSEFGLPEERFNQVRDARGPNTAERVAAAVERLERRLERAQPVVVMGGSLD